ncbi:MAG: SAF domain-containing protein [Desulfosporosinus sp.]|nr:SAF domain-containing protein [Desulfosporosinus sp.]
MNFRFNFPIFQLTSSRKARSKALTMSIFVGIITFILATVGGKLTMGQVTSVVVATNDLQPGHILTAADLKDDGRLSGVLPASVITSKDAVIGLSLSYPIKAGQPLIKGLVADIPIRNGLYPGEVGVWVPVSLTTSGLVKPGDIVSVYLTPDRNGTPSEMISSLEGVRVVAVINNTGQQIQANPSNLNGNVPVAVQLAIPKENAGAFSQFATGKVSLVIDPFATPKTQMGSTMAPPSDIVDPPLPPSMPEQSQGIDTPPNTPPTTQSTPQGELDNINPDSVTNNPETYNPPIYNPNGN